MWIWLSALALGNGQTAHVWITRQAIELTPAGAVGDFVRDPAHEAMLIHGSMFPDGGYAIGHEYGELAHWEPLQSAYLEWIKATYDPPYDGEAGQHVAFLFGMASHGFGDQVYDSLYMERSKRHDAELGWSNGGEFDEATDVLLAAEVGAQELPETWVPASVLPGVFESHAGVQVSADQLNEAQSLLRVAVGFVGLASAHEEAVEERRSAFPWGAAFLTDPSVAGSPADEARVIPAYWAVLWGRLHDQPAQGVIHVWPAAPGDGLTTDPAMPETWASVALAHGLLQADVTAEHFSWVDEDGEPVPLDPWLFYRNNSHIIHLRPTEALTVDTQYEVTVKATLQGSAGPALLADHRFPVSTYPAAVPEPDGDSGEVDTGPAPEPSAEGCGCHTQPSSGGALPMLLALLGVRRRRQWM